MRRILPLSCLIAICGCSAPLIRAAANGDQARAEKLLAARADVNAQGRDMQGFEGTPLMHAARNGRLEMAQFLLDHGADLALQNDKGDTALTWACIAQDADMARLLLSRGAKPQPGDVRVAEESRLTTILGLLASAAKGQAVAAPNVKAVASLALPAVDTPRYHEKTRPDDVAVVVGIERYQGLPPAQYAEHDALAVRDHLRALGFADRNIILLTGDQASKAGLIKNVETRLPNLVKADSLVFFYYSGHGAPEPTTGTAYLLPADGDPQYLQDTAYPVSRLYDRLGKLTAKRVIVALDACFSGAGGRSVLPKGTRPLVTKIDAGELTGQNVVALTASGASQISGALDGPGHGAFTYYLLRGLNGEAKDASGRVTVASLYRYVAPNVEDAARRDNRDQTPQLLPPTLKDPDQIVLR